MRLKTFIVLVTVLVLGWPGVAHAKGPTEATIEGDSLEAPIVLSIGKGKSDDDFWKLAEQSGFYETTFRQTPDPTMDAPPTKNLGPSFTVTWTVPYEEGMGAASTIVNTLYPYAEGGALLYSEPGQRIYDAATNGGWMRSSRLLPTMLERLGVPAPGTDATTSTPAPSRPATDDTRNWWPVSIVVAAAVAGLGGLFLARGGACGCRLP